MKNFPGIIAPAAAFAVIALMSAQPAQAQQAATSFFVTSNGPGKGADLGGLAGADAQCQTSRRRRAPVPRPGTLICRPRKPTAR